MAEKIQAILGIMRSEPLYNPHGDPALVEANNVLKNYADRMEAALKRVTEFLECKVEFEESRANQYFHEAQEAKKFLAELLYYTLEHYDEVIASTAFVGCVKDSCATLGISYSPHGRDTAVPVQEYLNDSYAKPKKLDEAAFDAAVSKPNGWNEVADPVAEVRRMRGDEPRGNAAALRKALKYARDVLAFTCRIDWRTTMAWGELHDAIHKADATLAAPPRNCDVGTSKEIDARWNAYCAKRIKRENCMSYKNCKGCVWRWAQMPYEEGGAE